MKILTKENKPYAKPVTSALVAASSYGAYKALNFAADEFVYKYQDFSEKFKNADLLQTENMKKAVKSAFNMSGLKEKGVKFALTSVLKTESDVQKNIEYLLLNPETKSSDMLALDILCPEVEENLGAKSLLERAKGFLYCVKDKFFPLNKNADNAFIDIPFGEFDSYTSLKLGDGAFYSAYTNGICVPEKVRVHAAFHEMGHALNNNCGKFSKMLQKMAEETDSVRKFIILGALLLPSSKDENKDGNFLENNIGKLIVAASLPEIAEEALASHRGEKLAKQVLNDIDLKGVKVSNRISLSTYVVNALVMALVGIGAVKTKQEVRKFLEKHFLKKPFFAEENRRTKGTKN